MAISSLGYVKNNYENLIANTKKTSAGESLYERMTSAGESLYERMSRELSAKQEETGQQEEAATKVKVGKTEIVKGSRLQLHLSGEDKKAPYSYLADGGVIEYNGVTFYCDTEKNQLHLGDTSDKKNCLTIPLEAGGALIVNRENLGDLSNAIGMFSPEDVNRIMRAIHQDTKVKQSLNEIDEMEEKVSDLVY